MSPEDIASEIEAILNWQDVLFNQDEEHETVYLVQDTEARLLALVARLRGEAPSDYRPCYPMPGEES